MSKSRARTTVACLLMGLAVLAASCATTARAQDGSGVNLGMQVKFKAASEQSRFQNVTGVFPGVGSGFGCKQGMLPPKGPVKLVTFNMTVYNKLYVDLPVVRTPNATLGSPEVLVMAPPQSKPMPLHVHVEEPASSANLVLQVLPDKKYVNVTNVSSMVVDLTSNLLVVVVEFCKSSDDGSGLLLEVTNELTRETQTLCVEVDPST